MRKLFALALGLFLALPVYAATLNVTWTHPTLNTDGSTIPASGPGSLTGTRVEYGTCSGSAFGTAIAETVVAAPAADASFANVGPGTYCARAFSRNTYGQESAASNVALKVVPAPVPQPPTLVTIATTAYELRLYNNGTLRFVQVGTVPLGAACGPLLAGDYAIFDGATLSKQTTGGIIAARCG